jgi:hypothetical protein
MAIGRISGPMLKADLLREGVDLAFDTDLLYLDVSNNRIGINKTNPEYDLDVNGTTRTSTIEITGIATIGNVTISGNSIDSTTNILELGTGNTVVYQKKIDIDDIEIEDNVIRTITPDANIEFRPDTGGSVQIYSDANIYGDIFVSGNITAEGNIVIGDDQLEDTVIFNAKFASDLIPSETSIFNLGSATKRWKDVYVTDFYSTNVIVDDLVVNDIDLRLRQGNIFYVAINGDDLFSGTHQNDPFRTVKKALSEAVSGDTIFVYPGIYEEIFPLTVPVGVTISGSGIRSVTIIPTVGTQNLDAFLLNGETTVENLTVKDFYYNSVNNTGHAFRFAPNCKITKRSPYIRNVSVITQGTTTSSGDPRGYASGNAGRGAYLDGAVIDPTSNEAGFLFNAVTFITPGVDAVTFTNGVRVEWLNCFTYFAKRSVYCFDGTAGKYNAGKSALRVSGVVGNITVGETISYFDTDGITLLESATINQVDTDGKLYVTGKADGFELASERGGKTIQAFGDAKLSTAVKKFGSASLALDGNGDYAFVQSSLDFGYGTADFTIEFWIYRTVSGIIQILYDQRTSSATTYSPVVFLNVTNQIAYTDGEGITKITGSTTVPLNAWSHVAVSRSGTSTRLFLNGVQEGSTYSDNRNYIATPVRIGSRWNDTGYFTGFIDDLRIVKGVAIYTANFTVPITRALVTPETVLMARFDGENNSVTFLDDAVYDQDIRFSGGATANRFTLTDFTDFGAEVRMIGSASVYGEFGLVGQGPGIIVYAIGHNLAYIGNEKETTNDSSTVIQANEVVEIDRAKIRYSSVDHRGDFRVGDLFFVNQETGTISFTAANFNVDSSTSFTFTDGSNTTFIDGSQISTGNLKISGNTIESLTGDVNFFAASDQINLQNNVNVTGNLTVDFNFTVDGSSTFGSNSTDTIAFNATVNSNIIPTTNLTYNLGSVDNKWQSLYVGQILVDDIRINNNIIETTTTNTNLELLANGTGSVVIDDISISDAVISTTGNLEIIPGSGIVRINGTGSLVLPKGTTAERPTPESGQIRFNTTLDIFEGYDGVDWIQLHGVIDQDRDTKVTAELTQGANDNIIRFVVQNQTVADIDSARLRANKIIVDDIEIDNNQIRTITSNTDLLLSAPGTGRVRFENFAIKNNTITNVVSDSITVFENLNNGYVKIDGTRGVVIPTGSSIQRPSVLFREAGMIRFNVDDRRIELFDGTSWGSVAGPQSGITAAQAQDIAVSLVLMLG